MAVIRTKGLEKTYSGTTQPALNGVDLHVEEKAFFGLLGPNGAGKTTLISILSGVLRPSRGEAWVCDVDVGRHPRRLSKHIGLVPQDLALYPELTVRENLEYFGRMHGLRDRVLRERTGRCLSLVGLEDAQDRRVSTCSGGMKRRLNLVVGILHEPPLLILDEPTVGVDAQTRNGVYESLRHLNDSGVTIVYTTHYMEEAAELCSHIAILDGGRIIQQGSPSGLIAATPDCGDLEQVFLALTGKALRD